MVWANTRKDELVSINVVTGMMLATLALSAAVVGEFDALVQKLNPGDTVTLTLWRSGATRKVSVTLAESED